MISSPTSSYFFFFLVAFLTISYQNPSQRNPGASSFLFSSSKDAGGRNVASRLLAEIFHFAFLELVSFLFRIHFALRPFGFWFHFDWFPFGHSFPKRCKDRLPKTAGKKTANLHYMEYAILIRGTFRGAARRDPELNPSGHFEDSNPFGTANKASIERVTFERKTAQANRLRRSLIADAL